MLLQRLVAGLVLGALSVKAAEGDSCGECVSASRGWQLTLNLKTHKFTSVCATTETPCGVDETSAAAAVVCITDDEGCGSLGDLMTKPQTDEDIPDGAVWGGCSGTNHYGTDCAVCTGMDDGDNGKCKWVPGAGCVASANTDGDAVPDCTSVAGTCDACTTTGDSYAIDVAFGSGDTGPKWTSSCRPCQPRVSETGVTKCVAGGQAGCNAANDPMTALFGGDWKTSSPTPTDLSATPLCYANALKGDCTACKATDDSAAAKCVSLQVNSEQRAEGPAVACVEDSEKAVNDDLRPIGTCSVAPATECSKCADDKPVLKEVLDLTAQTVVSYECVAAGDCTEDAANPKAYTRCLAKADADCPVAPTVAPQHDPADPDPTAAPWPIDVSGDAGICFKHEGSFLCTECLDNTGDGKPCKTWKVDDLAFCLPAAWTAQGATEVVASDPATDCPASPELQNCADCVSKYGSSFVVKTVPNFDTVVGGCAADCSLSDTETHVAGFCASSIADQVDHCKDLAAAINDNILDGGNQQLPGTSCFAHARQGSCKKCTDGGKCAWDSAKFICTPMENDPSETLIPGGSPSPAPNCDAESESTDGSACDKCASGAYMVSVRAVPAESHPAIAGCVPACPTDEIAAFAPELGVFDCVQKADCGKPVPTVFPNTNGYVADPSKLVTSGDLELAPGSCWGLTCPDCFAATTPAPDGNGAKVDPAPLCVYLNTPAPAAGDSKGETPAQSTVFITQGCVPSAWWTKNQGTDALKGKFEAVKAVDKCPDPPTDTPGGDTGAAHGLTVLSTVAVTALAALLL